MDNALYVGLSRQLTLRRELDIVANNIANADTTGFKVESLMVGESPQAPAQTFGAPNSVSIRLRLPVGSDKNAGLADAMAKRITLGEAARTVLAAAELLDHQGEH